ncbi:MAG TPA: hypothetical protein PLD59_06000 [Tepidisphaeraceae bacterium]|nr:hypothetical protein [Tepidisphaeraceae bacterium]
MKWLKIAFIAIPVIIITAVMILFLRIDSIVRSTVESQAAKQLSVPAKLGAARVGILSGYVSLSNFDLGSPTGFASQQMFQLGSVDAKVSYSELRQTPMRITSIDINKPTLVLEQQAMRFNVKAFIDQLPPFSDDSETVRMIIDELRISGAKVLVRPGIPGLAEEIQVNVPSIDVKNIGTADGATNGAAIKDVVITVITQLARSAAESDQIPPELRDILRGDVQAMIDDKLKAIGGQLHQAAEDLLKDPSRIEDVGKDLEKGLKDLVPRKPAKNPEKDN